VAVQSSAIKNIKLHCIIAMQKHQLWQQFLSPTRAVWPHEQPTVAKDLLRWCWSGRGRKYYLKQWLHCLFNSHKLVSRVKTKTKTF